MATNKININVTSDFWPKGFDGLMLKVILVLIAVALVIKIVNLYQVK